MIPKNQVINRKRRTSKSHIREPSTRRITDEVTRGWVQNVHVARADYDARYGLVLQNCFYYDIFSARDYSAMRSVFLQFLGNVQFAVTRDDSRGNLADQP